MAVDWWLPGNNGVHWKLHNNELLWLFFPIYMERPGLLLCTQSWFSVVPTYCKCLIQESRDLALKEKLRTEYFCNRPRLLQTCLPKALSPAGLQGRWSCWQPAVWPYTFCHRRVIFPDLKNLMAHECWADFIKQINMTTSLLKTSGSSHCQCCGVYAFFSQALFGPSNSGQGVWRVFCVWHGQSEK